MPERENINEAYLHAVRQEYAQIDETWLRLHYRISTGLVLFSFLVELGMGILLVHTPLPTTSAELFFLKFLIFPGAANFLCIAAGGLIMRSAHFSQGQKIYSISLLLVGICFILFTVHVIFEATYFIFTIAIVLTIVYANYYVTGITALASISSLVFSEFFIAWDTEKVSVFQSTYELANFLIALFSLTAFSMVCMVVIRFERRKNSATARKEVERQQLRERILLDEMTGLYNRKAFHTKLEELAYTAVPERCALAMVDVDKFKSINDTWGHQAGDLCLIAFSNLLKVCPAGITPFRYGGDEFCLIFQGMNLTLAEAFCRELLFKVNRLSFTDYPELRLTASFGLAESTEEIDVVRLFTHADRALYEAKEVRNTIRVFR